MEENIFKLSTDQLEKIALTLQERIEEGLEKDGREIRCLPTYINPNKNIEKGKVLVLDLGGTNFRAAVIEFTDGKPLVHPGVKKDLSYVMKKPEEEACDRSGLFKEIFKLIESLDLSGVTAIGYCFSYPCESKLDGDALLLYWTKGVTVKGMVRELVGAPLLKELNEYLKKHKDNFTEIKTIKVINDTIASLFSGLTDKKSQAHIGLIVGTGTNMAPFFPKEKIKKLDSGYTQKGLVPVNLESGNFNPPFLTVIDDKIDKYSDSTGAQRFEKAISGMYLGRILEYFFSCDEFEANFDAEKLSRIMSYPDMYKEKYVQVAHWVYERSAQLVAASMAGLIKELVETYAQPVTSVRLAAEGSLFWSESQSERVKFKSYKCMVMDELETLLKRFGYPDIKVYVEKKNNANLIGSAIAALS